MSTAAIILIILAVILLLVGIGVGVYFAFFRKTKTPATGNGGNNGGGNNGGGNNGGGNGTAQCTQSTGWIAPTTPIMQGFDETFIPNVPNATASSLESCQQLCALLNTQGTECNFVNYFPTGGLCAFQRLASDPNSVVNIELTDGTTGRYGRYVGKTWTSLNVSRTTTQTSEASCAAFCRTITTEPFSASSYNNSNQQCLCASPSVPQSSANFSFGYNQLCTTLA